LLFRLKEAGLWLDAPLDGQAEGAKDQGAAAVAPVATVATVAVAGRGGGRGGGRPSKGFVKVTFALGPMIASD